MLSIFPLFFNALTLEVIVMMVSRGYTEFCDAYITVAKHFVDIAENELVLMQNREIYSIN